MRTACWQAKWELPLPIIVLGGIYSGYFAVSEAAAVTVLYVLATSVFIYREIPLRRLPKIMHESMIMVGAILLILGLSLASTNYLSDQATHVLRERVHEMLAALSQPILDEKTDF